MRSYHVERFGDLDGIVMRADDAPVPAPGPHEVVVRVRATSLNYRDIAIVRGFYYGRTFPDGVVPVSDGAGEIVAVGDKVRGFSVGDRVVGLFRQFWLGGPMPLRANETDLGGGLDGMLRDYAVLHEEGIAKFPDHLSYGEAATLPCAALTAWHALRAGATLQAGETVLIMGSGGVSIFGLQFARQMGARIIATSSSDEKLERMRSLGAGQILNYRTHPDWDVEIMRMTDGRGVDRVLEVGGPGTLERSMRCSAFNGRVIVIGVLTGKASVDPAPILGRRLTLQAISTGSREMFEDMSRAIALSGLKPAIDKVFPFENTRDAYRYLEDGKHFGKVVVDHS